jgi:hypothetical protein
MVYNVMTGTELLRLTSEDTGLEAALDSVSAIYYDEDSHQIYTGNEQGLVHVWSN